MNPVTSRTATGSFMPASPSSVRARRRRSVEPRSTAKIAAPSVDDTIAPMSRPCSRLMSNSRLAPKPTMIAVISVPTVARLNAGTNTGRISCQPDARPPSYRMSASAMIPTVWASS